MENRGDIDGLISCVVGMACEDWVDWVEEGEWNMDLKERVSLEGMVDVVEFLRPDGGMDQLFERFGYPEGMGDKVRVRVGFWEGGRGGKGC